MVLALSSCGDDPTSEDGLQIKELLSSSVYTGQVLMIKGKGFGDAKGSNFVTIADAPLADSCYFKWTNDLICVQIDGSVNVGNVVVNIGGIASNTKPLSIKSIAESSDLIIKTTSPSSQVPLSIIALQGVFGDTKGTVELNGEQMEITNWTKGAIMVTIPDEAVSGKIIAYTSTGATNPYYFTVLAGTRTLDMVLLQPSEFYMGSDEEGGDYLDYGPKHKVKLTRAFYICKYEIKQSEYQKIVGTNPAQHKGNDFPVERVTWEKAVKFCNTLSKQEYRDTCYTLVNEEWVCNYDANGYRLPTEAEWEYACRGGVYEKYGSGFAINSVGWTLNNADNNTHEYGMLKPNSFGIYDMHGNVHEWVNDWYEMYYGYNEITDVPALLTDPTGVVKNNSISERVHKGGAFDSSSDDCTCAARAALNPTSGNYNLGFRVVRTKK